MKKYLCLYAAALIALLPVNNCWADEEETDSIVTPIIQQGFYQEDTPMPDMIRILPPPPAKDSPLFYNDWCQYVWGQKMRLTERNEQAVSDADFATLNSSFSGAMGIEISPENTPQLWILMDSLFCDLNKATRYPKDYYARPRPFVLFNDSCGTPEEQERLKLSYSYPSGHTTIAWGIGLVLAEIHPAGMDSIFSRAYQMGVSRVIVGAHYQSDVDAGRLLASMVIAQLHTIPAFQEQLMRAKKEFEEKKKSGQETLIQVPVTQPSQSSHTVPHPYYTLDGQRLASLPSHSGIYITNGQKVVVK